MYICTCALADAVHHTTCKCIYTGKKCSTASRVFLFGENSWKAAEKELIQAAQTAFYGVSDGLSVTTYCTVLVVLWLPAMGHSLCFDIRLHSSSKGLAIASSPPGILYLSRCMPEKSRLDKDKIILKGQQRYRVPFCFDGTIFVRIRTFLQIQTNPFELEHALLLHVHFAVLLTNIKFSGLPVPNS